LQYAQLDAIFLKVLQNINFIIRPYSFRFECHQNLKSHEIYFWQKIGKRIMTRHLHRLIFFRESFSISAIMALYILLLRSGVSSSKYSWGRFWSFTLFSSIWYYVWSTGILTYESICFIIFIVYALWDLVAFPIITSTQRK
jgi:hypothetical protein